LGACIDCAGHVLLRSLPYPWTLVKAFIKKEKPNFILSIPSYFRQLGQTGLELRYGVFWERSCPSHIRKLAIMEYIFAFLLFKNYSQN
jgi:hypothetical protein